MHLLTTGPMGDDEPVTVVNEIELVGAHGLGEIGIVIMI